MVERTDLTERGAPDRSTKEIRQDIAAKRESISETVDRLGDRIHQTLDWREHVTRHPYLAVAAAAGVGFLLSRIFRRRPTPGERIMDAVAETFEDFTDNLRNSVQHVIWKTAAPGVIKGTISALATKAAIEFLKSRAAASSQEGADSTQSGPAYHQDPAAPWADVASSPEVSRYSKSRS